MDYKELFFASVNENVSGSEDSSPASEYSNGDNNNATFDDLIELIGTVENYNYNEIADIILDYTHNGLNIDTTEVQFGDLITLIKDLDKEDYNDVADDLLDYLEEMDGIVERFMAEHFNETDEDGMVEAFINCSEYLTELDEGFLKRLASFNKSRKKFSLSGAKMKVNKLKNKAKNRVKRIAGRVKRKVKRFATKKYNAFRNKAIKTGRHVAKMHRGLKK